MSDRILLAFFLLAVNFSNAQSYSPLDTTIVNSYGDTITIKDRTVVEKKYGKLFNRDIGQGIHLIKRQVGEFIVINNENYDPFQGEELISNLFEYKDGQQNLRYPLHIFRTKISKDIIYIFPNYLPTYGFYEDVRIYNNIDSTTFINPIGFANANAITIKMLKVTNNLYYNFGLNNLICPSIYFSRNILSNDLDISRSVIGNLAITHNDATVINIGNSKIHRLELHENVFLKPSIEDLKRQDISFNYYLNADTILNGIEFYNTTYSENRRKDQIDTNLTCYFLKTSINGNVDIRDVPFKKIVFERCSFGADFTIGGDLDTIQFIGNSHIADNIDLNPLGKSDRIIYLSFGDDFDVSKLHFDYTEQFQLLLEMGQERAFLRLKEKFIQEGNTASAARIGRELKQLQYKSKGLSGHVMNFIENQYWRYGYDKARPIIVLSSILLLFSLINFIFWESMNKAYKVGDDENPQKDMTIQLVPYPTKTKSAMYYFNYSKTVVQNYLWVLLYTSIIFFSIRISKDRLHFKNNGLAIFSYFFQYVLGLFLLLITVKFVLGL